MPRDCHGNELSIGDSVTLQAVVEDAFPYGPETKNVCLRLVVPPGAPNAIVYCSGISVERIPDSPSFPSRPEA